jgi:DNA-binding MarR family transcriptional regulator
MNRKSGAARSPSAHRFTENQGQYLAFIYTYSHMFRQPPAETDMQRHFEVSPPSVHQMIVTLERNGLIRRQPGVNPASPEASKSSLLRRTSPS